MEGSIKRKVALFSLLFPLSFSSFFLISTAYSSYPNGSNPPIANVNDFNNASDWQAFPIMPRFNATAWSGDDAVTAGDILLPLVGGDNGLFYTDFQGKYGDETTWMLGAGAGYRRIIDEAYILGGYLFFEQDQTHFTHHDELHNTQFSVLNPGLEAMTERFDFRVNGYFPVSDKRKFDHSAWGDELGIASDVTFKDHQQFDHLYRFFDEVGNGFDAEAGLIFPNFNRLAVYAGGYYFSISHSDIGGFAGRIEYPFNKFVTAFVADTYDQVTHNTFAAGVRFSIGGIPRPLYNVPFDIHSRITDPVIRDLSTLNTGSGIPSKRVREKVVRRLENGEVTDLFLERDKIWFFSKDSKVDFKPGKGLNQCTITNPCTLSSFNQENVNFISKKFGNIENYYFNNDSVVASLNKNPFDLINGSMWGRTPDFTMPAVETGNLPIFEGSLKLKGGNTLDSIFLRNSTDPSNHQSKAAIDITNANDITISNMVIGTLSSANSYSTVVNMDNAKNIQLIDDVLNAYSEKENVNGINMDKSTAFVRGTTVNAVGDYENKDRAGATFTVAGINLKNDSEVTVKADSDENGSEINANVFAVNTVNVDKVIDKKAPTFDEFAIGIEASTAGSNKVTVDDSFVNASAEYTNTSTGTLTDTGSSSYGFATSLGIDVEDKSKEGTSSLDISNSIITSSVNACNQGNVNGLFHARADGLTLVGTGANITDGSVIDVSSNSVNSNKISNIKDVADATNNSETNGISGSIHNMINISDTQIVIDSQAVNSGVTQVNQSLPGGVVLLNGNTVNISNSDIAVNGYAQNLGSCASCETGTKELLNIADVVGIFGQPSSQPTGKPPATDRFNNVTFTDNNTIEVQSNAVNNSGTRTDNNAVVNGIFITTQKLKNPDDLPKSQLLVNGNLSIVVRSNALNTDKGTNISNNEADANGINVIGFSTSNSYTGSTINIDDQAIAINNGFGTDIVTPVANQALANGILFNNTASANYVGDINIQINTLAQNNGNNGFIDINKAVGKGIAVSNSSNATFTGNNIIDVTSVVENTGIVTTSNKANSFGVSATNKSIVSINKAKTTITLVPFTPGNDYFHDATSQINDILLKELNMIFVDQDGKGIIRSIVKKNQFQHTQ